MSETATVELLTAEVRVLMVGSRQVTLSMAKQLDELPLESVEPFGRCRIGNRVKLIGRARRDGSLVLTEFRTLSRRVTIFKDDLDLSLPLPVMCRKWTRFDHCFEVPFHTWNIRISDDAVTYCEHDFTAGTPECVMWEPSGQGESIHAAIAAWETVVERHRCAAALPLIVLAGLR